MKKISVIVPVYNVEKYIDKCLDSLVNQTLEDIEIIVVNDGTPDNSQFIIDKYASKYPEKVFSYIKENGGLSDARNYGMKYARGEYVAFVDSDDYIEKDMYENMYKKAKEKDFDIVDCNIKYVFDNSDNVIHVMSGLDKDLVTKEDIKMKMLDFYPAAWNKIYKREKIENFKFKKNVWFEDVEFIYRLMPFIESFGHVDGYYYDYMQRDGAITKTVSPKIFHYIDNWNGILDFYKEKELYDEYKDILEYCYVRYIYATFIKAAAKFKKRSEFKEAYNKAKEAVSSHFPNYKQNKYFDKMGKKGFYLKHLCWPLARIIHLLG